MPALALAIDSGSESAIWSVEVETCSGLTGNQIQFQTETVLRWAGICSRERASYNHPFMFLIEKYEKRENINLPDIMLLFKQGLEMPKFSNMIKAAKRSFVNERHSRKIYPMSSGPKKGRWKTYVYVNG